MLDIAEDQDQEVASKGEGVDWLRVCVECVCHMLFLEDARTRRIEMAVRDEIVMDALVACGWRRKSSSMGEVKRSEFMRRLGKMEWPLVSAGI